MLRALEARHIGAAFEPVNARNRSRLMSLSEEQAEALMDPLTPLDTLCRIILRAREYEAQTASDYDRGEDPDNVDDEQEGALSVLEDDINDSVEEELQAAFEDLGEDQLAEVIAFCWVGQAPTKPPTGTRPCRKPRISSAKAARKRSTS